MRKREKVICPFTIVIDTAEGQPYSFTEMKSDANQEHRPLVVNTEFACCGRWPNSYGDYSIKGFEHRIAIERKSMEDAHSTILGWDGRRERFECELENLAKCEAAMVVVECSFEQLIQEAPQWGAKTKSQNAKSLSRSVLAFMRRYRVPWLFAGGRRMAEIHTFRFLEGFFFDQMKQRKKAEKVAAKDEIEAALAGL